MIKPSLHGPQKSKPPVREKALPRSHRMLLGMIMVSLITVSGISVSGQSTSKGRDPYTPDMAKCAGFNSQDAAQLLKLPASKLAVKIEKLSPELWRCSFITPDDKGISFSVSVTKSAKKAVEEMEQLRDNLELAAETAPFKNKLPQGAYSEILNLGE